MAFAARSAPSSSSRGATIDPPKGSNADLSGVVELGFVVYCPRRIAHGAARRDRGGGPRYAGESHGFEASVVEGRFMIHTHRGQSPWVVIVEPDSEAMLLVVVTVYEVSQ